MNCRIKPGRFLAGVVVFAALSSCLLGGGARAATCSSLFQNLLAPRLSAEEAKKLDRGVLADFDDLTGIKPPSAPAAQAWDRRVQRALENLSTPPTQPGELSSLKQEQIDDLFHQMKSNKVMEQTCEVPNKYDPDVKNQIGFCFGRAIGGHLLARKLGLTNDSIRKVWAVGDMKQDGIIWSHHVAVSVRRDDGKWFVLDPFDDHPLPLADWFKEYSDSSTDGRLMLFATKADRFGPESPDPIFKSTVKDGYNGFFRDLFRGAREEGDSVKKQLRLLSQ